MIMFYIFHVEIKRRHASFPQHRQRTPQLNPSQNRPLPPTDPQQLQTKNTIKTAHDDGDYKKLQEIIYFQKGTR